MWSSLVEYQRPATIDSCLRLLSRIDPHTVPFAGGTWLMAQRDPKVEAVVDLSALNLAYIKHSARRIRLGAMTTLQALIESPSIQDLANGLLREAIYNTAPRAIRNIATLGGTIVVGNSFSEVCLALLALDAQVVICSNIVRSIPLHDFFANRVANLPHASIITEINIPQPTTRIGSAIAKVSRTPHSQPVVVAAAQVSRVGNNCRVARIALGGLAEHAFRLPEIEAMVAHQKIDAALCDRVAEAVKGAIHFPLAKYQCEMAGIVVGRALQEAWERIGKE